MLEYLVPIRSDIVILTYSPATSICLLIAEDINEVEISAIRVDLVHAA